MKMRAVAISPRIVLNVGGEIYETHTRTLRRFPESLLGNPAKRSLHYCTKSHQYFFNRSRVFFDAILFFYQSNGLLSCPDGIPLDLFIEECHYFEIPEDAIHKLKPREQQPGEEADNMKTNKSYERKTIRSKIWDVLQNPESSKSAKVFSILSFLMIILAVVSTCAESVPSVQVKTDKFEENPWAVSELLLNSWFLAELVLSVSCTPDIKGFLTSSMTWVDMVAVIPYFVLLVVSQGQGQSLRFLRIIRLARVSRMFRLSKHSARLKLVGQILLSCMGDFRTVLMCCLMIVMLSGSLVTYLEDEGRNGSGFTSIPQGMYWATITLTTVGYGDIVPFSIGGRIFATAYMFFGAATLTIPLLSIVVKFEENYKPN